MKIHQNFVYVICFCVVFINFGCEQTDIPVHQVRDDPITKRGDPCGDCAFISDCCCVIEYVSGDGAVLRLCGTSDGIDACTGGSVGSCDVNDGGGLDINISSSNPRHYLCMDPGQPFWIAFKSGATVTIKITCQADEFNPQTIMATLGSMDRFYYSTNGSCELDGC